MSKIAAPSTQAAIVLAPEAPVTVEDLVEVVQQQHEALATWCPVLMAWNGAPAGVMTASSPSCLNLQFDSASFVVKLRGHIRVSADYQQLRIGGECDFAAAESGEIRVTIGAGTPVVLAFLDSDNGSIVSDVIAAPAPGLYAVTVELRRTIGASLTNSNLDGWIQVEPIAAADIPDPADA